MACSRFKLQLACICQAVYTSIPPVRGLSSHGSDGSGFDSGDCRGSCRMIIKMGTELPTRCYHVQASESLEGFPHNTPAQACEAPKLLSMETQTTSGGNFRCSRTRFIHDRGLRTLKPSLLNQQVNKGSGESKATWTCFAIEPARPPTSAGIMKTEKDTSKRRQAGNFWRWTEVAPHALAALRRPVWERSSS